MQVIMKLRSRRTKLRVPLYLVSVGRRSRLNRRPKQRRVQRLRDSKPQGELADIGISGF